MKKKLITACVLLMMSLATQTIAQTIPNNSFENWSTVEIPLMTDTIDINLPVDWTPFVSLVNLIFTGDTIQLFQSTDAFGGGNYAANFMIDSNGIGPDLLSAFPVSQKPQELKFWCKKSSSVDVFEANVIFTKWDPIGDSAVQVGGGSYSIVSDYPSYHEITVPIAYFISDIPDTAIIHLDYTSGTFGESCLIDELSFSGIVGIESPEVPPTTFVYPNPANDILNIKMESEKAGICTLYDINGKAIISEKIKGHQLVLNTSELAPGLYALLIQTGEIIETHKITIK
ncbi:MAG: T9SS type A sorting domain-containing protein [Saprospiraceae bacterium]|nr:T9SS type A sorting domain-containing protein [Saprospiraceae bacterium]